MRYLDWPAHRNERDALEYLQGVAERWESGSEYHWIIEDARTSELHGCIACRPSPTSADFGYFMARSSWGMKRLSTRREK